MILPLLALGSIVLYGTTRAAGPELIVPPPPARQAVEIGPSASPPPAARPSPPPPGPPPAPRLRSEELAEVAVAVAPDTVGVDSSLVSGPVAR